MTDGRRFVAREGDPGGYTVLAPKTRRIGSGGKRRDASLNPIVERLKERLRALGREYMEAPE